MYSDKMAVAVKAKGRVLRENKDQVYLPFGEEYTLTFKNLNSVRALVKVWIDGVDATDGTSGLIVPPNESVDLERFIKEGNLGAGNRFKFIERTGSISKHRGNKIDDGLIRVEFEFERQKPAYIPSPVYYPSYPTWPYEDKHRMVGSICNDSMLNSSIGSQLSNSIGGDEGVAMAASANYMSVSDLNVSYSATASSPLRSSRLTNSSESAQAPQPEVGITVPGSVSSQSFTWGSSFPTDGVKHTMVLRLLGEVDSKPVVAPVTVKHKPTCTSCGKVNKASAKFCSECGTGLQLV
jgi:hypothetical protein